MISMMLPVRLSPSKMTRSPWAALATVGHTESVPPVRDETTLKAPVSPSGLRRIVQRDSNLPSTRNVDDRLHVEVATEDERCLRDGLGGIRRFEAGEEGEDPD